jgi:hypothetical protein
MIKKTHLLYEDEQVNALRKAMAVYFENQAKRIKTLFG